ncbi:hypothetical protein [Ohtaekwangia koreensis]|uniref:Uncharacterized protein n=1 Tax=Ohtaekwangia koreensis TaxID=688867 RepID=A0A1T5MAW9_9BACT|nr:hypothetical protein [Ohtaekwangia koreensis]SKC84998.1 hypothetical protein SAMN05660236_4779 [Ohtaekwangia koreensis]
MPVKDEDTYMIGTVVRLKRTGEFAIIRNRCFLREDKYFLNYLGEIEGRPGGLYALYHEDIELECLPPE